MLIYEMMEGVAPFYAENLMDMSGQIESESCVE